MAVGRRKEAVVRVKLIPGTGKIIVNKRPFEEYFPLETQRIVIKQPLELTGSLNKYDIYANIKGGGISGQAGALRHGISRALADIEPSLKEILRREGFLTRDPRMKERKKYGQKGARKRFQWTKR
ncbi:MAG: 30S ribosomal protein S9 [Candidatus Omnitrophica bacterium]|nr:30S ribosomal protein S9 [Candidatus Omnitrophota bacterium]MCM8799503.1 30S ribosomal protein S9 [Candidatus Omnitrophota bacterium]